ncbi:MAG: hypothetical protein JKX94_05140, partial [Sneathiella sp.]|nr:hypothetical protein [Sneathiella sp.]
MLNANQLQLLYPKATEARIDAFLANQDRLFGQFGINKNSTRLHFFLAQIGHESAGLTRTTENLNYSAERLRVVWPSR